MTKAKAKTVQSLSFTGCCGTVHEFRCGWGRLSQGGSPGGWVTQLCLE